MIWARPATVILRALRLASGVAALAAILVAAPVRAETACIPRDFLSLELPEQVADPIATALSTAHPILSVVGGDLWFPDGTIVPTGTDRGLTARERIATPNVALETLKNLPALA